LDYPLNRKIIYIFRGERFALAILFGASRPEPRHTFRLAGVPACGG
jgi:hypothetical protein